MIFMGNFIKKCKGNESFVRNKHQNNRLLNYHKLDHPVRTMRSPVGKIACLQSAQPNINYMLKQTGTKLFLVNKKAILLLDLLVLSFHLRVEMPTQMRRRSCPLCPLETFQTRQ
jgi:hypothetical protein